MKLYFHPLSSYSQKVLVALYETQAAFEPVTIELFDPAAVELYRKLYPLGKIPLLELADGQLIPESTIIIEYLSEYHCSRIRLIPASADAARRTRFLDRLSDLYLNDPMTTILFDSWKPPEKREPERVAAARRTIGILYPYLDRELADRTWLAGAEFTMADCAAAPALNYLSKVPGCDFAEWRNLAAYAARLRERPSVKRVLDEALPHWQRLTAARAG